MEMSNDITQLSAALAEAQAAIGGAIKGKINPAFKSKYADLKACWEAWQEVGPPRGLGLIQMPGAFVDGKQTLTTMLTCKGEWIREVQTIPVSKQDAQACGSAITYARRQSLSGFVGIAPDDDDDGNAAVKQSRVPENEPTGPAGPVNADQLAMIRKALDDAGRDVAKFCAFYKIDALPDLPAAKFNTALSAIATAVANAKKAA